MAVDFPPVTPSNYVSPLAAKTNFEFVSAFTIFPYLLVNDFNDKYYKQTVFLNGIQVFENTYIRGLGGQGSNIGYTTALTPGSYEVVYEFGTRFQENYMLKTKAVYYFSVVENQLPLKRKTVTDVINRLFDVAEPIRKGELPRFVLQGMNADGTYAEDSQAAQFNKILSPEFSFTKQTLRECLQEIGKFIHGEPRVNIKKSEYVLIREEKFSSGSAALGANSTYPYDQNKTYYALINGQYYATSFYSEASGGDDDYYIKIDGLPNYSGTAYVYSGDGRGTYYYEISFDMYASQEESGVWAIPYISRGAQHNVENFATWIDSNAENLVNQLDKFSGVIVEPYDGGAKSVRTETQYTRIEDGNMLIATQYPIYTVEDVEYVYNDGGDIKSVSIKPWIFESSIYNSQLSSYDGAYPYSKTYGLYFTQGEKNIKGLNFKEPQATLQPFNDYAIINILRQATGNQGLNISDYPAMLFRVKYTPFYSVRVAQTKQYIGAGAKPSALIYNQQANVIESRAFGENMKGVIARLGNVERSVTFNVKWFSDIPKAGQIYKKDYYITAVATEIYPNFIKCTLGLSKDFNRLSAYIGISSVKRYYEVAQKQALERNVLYREYIHISGSKSYTGDTNIGGLLLQAIGAVFSPYGKDNAKPITNVSARGLTYKGNQTANVVSLPVISSAFGNSISFSWRYEDNFSAGAASVYQSNGNVTGYFQQDVQYADYYGAIYYLDFDLTPTGERLTADNLNQTPFDLPRINSYLPTNQYFSTEAAPYVLRKDNREIIQINVQIDFVTDIKDFIIGSALASYSPAVRGIESGQQPARLYVLPTTLNKFTDNVEAYENIKLSELPSVEVFPDQIVGCFILRARGAFPASGKSWVVVTPQTESTEQVEDERGNITTQTVIKGGNLLVGQNIDVTQGQAFPPVYFNARRNVFDMSVWKDKI